MTSHQIDKVINTAGQSIERPPMGHGSIGNQEKAKVDTLIMESR